MFCKILTDKNTEYTSVVLAVINPGWHEKVVVLNEDKTKI